MAIDCARDWSDLMNTVLSAIWAMLENMKHEAYVE